MKQENNVFNLSGRQEIADALTELLRAGAVQLIQQAVEAELVGFMEQFSGRLLEDGKAAVVRNGYQPERNSDRYWPGKGQDTEGAVKGWNASYLSFSTGTALCA